MMVDSVADIAEREQKFPNKSTKVGILLFFIMYFVTRNVKMAGMVLLAHAVLSLIF
jgi:hypothetical protein